MSTSNSIYFLFFEKDAKLSTYLVPHNSTKAFLFDIFAARLIYVNLNMIYCLFRQEKKRTHKRILSLLSRTATTLSVASEGKW